MLGGGFARWMSVLPTSVNSWLALLALSSSLVLGGSTSSGFLADVVVQLCCIPVLVWVLARPPVVQEQSPPGRNVLVVYGSVAAVLSIPLLQVVPLPPGWVSRPAGRISAAPLAEQGDPSLWLPISVSPADTWLALLSLIPPLAVFIATARMDRHDRRVLSLVLIGFGVFSAVLGLLQIAQGTGSPLRPFAFTNVNDAVGLFANRNHLAALIFTVLLLGAAWATLATTWLADSASSGRPDSGALTAVLLSALIMLVLVSAQAMTRSRAGVGLTIVALLTAFALTMFAGRGRVGTGGTRLMLGGIFLAVMFASQFALYRLMERFGDDPLADARWPFARNTLDAATAYWPFGSGVGTFVPVYAMFEKPSDSFGSYANRAHNDILELVLETGALGMAVLALITILLLWRTATVWTMRAPRGAEVDVLLMRAASVAVLLIGVHSLVDYPLRTAAMMVVFAFACGLLVAPSADHVPRPVEPPADIGKTKRQKSSSRPPAETRPRPSGPGDRGTAPTSKPQAGWGADVTWPDAWRKPDKSGETT